MNTFFFDDVQYPEGLFGGKDFFNPIIYSTEEREVGVWVDGRPLYQKTFITNVTLTSGVWASTGDSILNGKAIDAEVTTIGQGSDTIPVWGEISSDGHIELLNIRGSGQVTITHYTVRYFKTTDTAGSGSYTTLGVPAVHYDDNEKVVGTWFGETLYQKIVSFDNVTINANGFASYQLSQYINNLSHAIFHKTVAITTGGYSELPSVHVGEKSGYAWSSALNNNELYISRGNASGVTADYKVVVEYTKTS